MARFMSFDNASAILEFLFVKKTCLDSLIRESTMLMAFENVRVIRQTVRLLTMLVCVRRTLTNN